MENWVRSAQRCNPEALEQIVKANQDKVYAISNKMRPTMTAKDRTKALQQSLGYRKDEVEQFLSDPGRAQVATKAPALYKKVIVAQVVESHGCLAQHHKGDCIYLNGFGHLLLNQNKKDVCVFAMHALAPVVFAANELHYADVDPNRMCLKNVGCLDVGLHCGGVGHVTFSFRMEDLH